MSSPITPEEAKHIVDTLGRHARVCPTPDLCAWCQLRDAASRYVVTVTTTLLQKPADAARAVLKALPRPDHHEGTPNP